MKKSLIIAFLSFFTSLLLVFSSCNNDDNEYYYETSEELKSQINKGVSSTAANEKAEFELLYNDVMKMCLSEKMGIISNPFIYLEQPEYQAFRSFFENSSSLNIYFLLIDKYMLCEHGVFPYMFADIADMKYPGIVREAEIKANMFSSTYENIIKTFPDICIRMLIERLELERNENE